MIVLYDEMRKYITCNYPESKLNAAHLLPDESGKRRTQIHSHTKHNTHTHTHTHTCTLLPIHTHTAATALTLAAVDAESAAASLRREEIQPCSWAQGLNNSAINRTALDDSS